MTYVCIQVKADSKSRFYSLHSLMKIYFEDHIVITVTDVTVRCIIAAELDHCREFWEASDLPIYNYCTVKHGYS